MDIEITRLHYLREAASSLGHYEDEIKCLRRERDAARKDGRASQRDLMDAREKFEY